MVTGGLLFVAVTVMVRLLGSDMPAVQAAFIRYLVGVLLVLPMLWRMRGRSFGRGVRGGTARAQEQQADGRSQEAQCAHLFDSGWSHPRSTRVTKGIAT